MKYKKHKKSNKAGNVGGGMGGSGNVGGVNGSGTLGGTKGAMGTTMLDKHIAAAAAAHHSQQQQQQHAQLAGSFLHHHKISSGDSLNSPPTPSHPNHPAHSGHLVNGTILKTALTNPSEVSVSSLSFLKWILMSFEMTLLFLTHDYRISSFRRKVEIKSHECALDFYFVKIFRSLFNILIS